MTDEKHLTVRDKEYKLAALPMNNRPTMCSEASIDTILTGIRQGLSYKDASTLAGISETTIYNWKRLGRNAQTREDNNKSLTYNDQMYLKFIHALNKAEVQQKQDALMKINEAAKDKKHWHAAAWLLERKHPDEFGRRNRVEIHDWRKEAKSVDVDAILKEVADKLEQKLLQGAEDAEYRDK